MCRTFPKAGVCRRVEGLEVEKTSLEKAQELPTLKNLHGSFCLSMATDSAEFFMLFLFQSVLSSTYSDI